MRKMNRWKKIVLWSLSVVFLLGIIGLFTANYVINRVLGSIAVELETDSQNNTTTTSSVEQLPTSTNTDLIKNDNAKENQNSLTNKDTVSDDVNSVNNETEMVSNSAKNANDKKVAEALEESQKKDNNNENSGEVSATKIKKVQEKVTVKEKAEVSSIILSKLSLSDMRRLQELAKGGLTLEEKKEARSIVMSEVSPEQYNQLSQIAKKYGVSEGKTYNQIIQEESMDE